jgi:hypothetical protein
MTVSRWDIPTSRRDIPKSRREFTTSRREIAMSQREFAKSRREISKSRREIGISRWETATSRRDIANSRRDIAGFLSRLRRLPSGEASPRRQARQRIAAPPPITVGVRSRSRKTAAEPQNFNTALRRSGASPLGERQSRKTLLPLYVDAELLRLTRSNIVLLLQIWRRSREEFNSCFRSAAFRLTAAPFCQPRIKEIFAFYRSKCFDNSYR